MLVHLKNENIPFGIDFATMAGTRSYGYTRNGGIIKPEAVRVARHVIALLLFPVLAK